MITQANVVDSNGFIIDPIVVNVTDVLEKNVIKKEVPQGFYTPKWDYKSESWVEGKPLDEILEILKSTKVESLNITCEKEIYSGFQATNGHLYEFETKDQANLSQMLLLLSMNTTMDDIQWKTVDAGILIHSRQDFMQVCMDAEMYKRGNISKYWKLKGLVETSNTVEEIQAITW